MDLVKHGIKTIIWATGYRPDYSWLDVPVLDRKGMIRHDGGVTAAPGLYLMGAPFLRRRKSTLIDGAGDDARDLSAHLASYLDGSGRHANSRITASTARAVARLGRDSRQAADGNPLGIRTLELLSLVRFSSATSS